MSPARCFALVILLGVVATSSGAEVTPEQARAVQAKFRAERETAAKQFPVSMLARADRLAARAEQALENNQPRDAMLGFREARWLLPVVPAELPANVSRV